MVEAPHVAVVPRSGRGGAAGLVAAGRRRPGRMAAAVLILLALAAPRPADAGGLNIAWNDCPPDGGVSHTTLSCSPAGTAVSLFGSFELFSEFADLVSLDVRLSILTDTATLPDFWRFDSPTSSGCNPGIVFGDELPASCAGLTSPWGTFPPGAEASTAFTYGIDTSGLPRGAFHGQIYRSVTDPFHVPADTEMFAFRLDFYFDYAVESGGPCEGCQAVGYVHFRDAWVGGAGGSGYGLSGPGRGTDCIAMNGAFPRYGCYTAVAQNRTWGAVKALYR